MSPDDRPDHVVDCTTGTPEKAWFSVFLDNLAKMGNISAAARAAGVGRRTAYNHRESDAGFAAAWDDALEVATDALEAEARRRALEGTEEPVFHQGMECGRIRKYSDTLAIFLLKAHRPGKFRENVQHEHSGDVNIRVTYVRKPLPDHAPPPHDDRD